MGDNDLHYPMPAFATLLVSNLEASRKFYVQGLGFQHVFSIPGPGGQTVVEHLRFSRYADLLLLQEPPGDLPGDAPRGLGIGLTFAATPPDRQADELAEYAIALGTPVEGPVARTWNTRDILVADPDGYILVFSEPLGMTKTMAEVLGPLAHSG
jgi:lactoylglutathione lyase